MNSITRRKIEEEWDTDGLIKAESHPNVDYEWEMYRDSTDPKPAGLTRQDFADYIAEVNGRAT